MNLTIALFGAAWLSIVVGVWLHARVAWRNHLRLEGVERAAGNQRLRQRMHGLVASHGAPREVVVHAENMRGWVWIRVTPRKPARGERRIQAHNEQMGWAMTKRGAVRKMEREVRGERGSGDLWDLVKIGLVLVLASFVLSKIGEDVSPGDLLDWLVDKAAAGLRAFADLLRT